MAHRPSGIPAWGGGSGARMASAAAAAKLRTVKDKERTRSASAAGFQSEAASSAPSSASWGFSASPPEPLEEESCPALTPSTTPVKTDYRPAARELDDGDAGAAPAAALVNRSAAAPITASRAATALPTDAQAALQALAGALSAAATIGGPAAVQLQGGSSWETAFLAGVAVGLQLPAAGRRSSAVQRALLAMAAICALVVLGGTALLLAGVKQAQPVMYYH